MNATFQGTAEKILESAANFPQEIALRLPATANSEEQIIKYEHLTNKIHRYRNQLLARGISKGDRIILLFPLSLDLVALMVAIMAIGAVTVFIDTGMSKKNILHSIKLVRAKAIFSVYQILKLHWFIPSLWRMQKFCTNGSGFLVSSVNDLSLSIDEQISKEVSSSDQALITFTSGTTGKPKAADRDQGIMYSQHIGLNEALDFPFKIRALHCFPVAILHHMANGEEIAMPAIDLANPSLVNPKLICDQMIAYKTNVFGGAPAFMEQVMNYIDDHDEIISKLNLKCIFVGGAQVPFPLAKKIDQLFPQSQNLILYGSTEAEPIAKIKMSEFIEFGNVYQYNVGFPAAICETAIVPLDVDTLQFLNTNTKRKLINQPGELLVTGPHVVQKYIFNPEANKETKVRTQDGRIWHRTGDFAQWDKDGRIILQGRVEQHKQFFDLKINPVDLEIRLARSTNVNRLVVIRFEENIAVVYDAPFEVRSEDCQQQIKLDLPDHLKNKIQIYRVDIFPTDRRHNSKIDHHILRTRLRNIRVENELDIFLGSDIEASEKSDLSRLLSMNRAKYDLASELISCCDGFIVLKKFGITFAVFGIEKTSKDIVVSPNYWCGKSSVEPIYISLLKVKVRKIFGKKSKIYVSKSSPLGVSVDGSRGLKTDGIDRKVDLVQIN